MGNNLILSAVILGLWAGVSGLAKSADLPVINEPRAEFDMVNGKAAPGSAPITVYDLSYSVRTMLGSSKSMDDAGNFAVLVSPSLVAGHEIVAVDKDGNTSLPIVVIAPDPQPDATK